MLQQFSCIAQAAQDRPSPERAFLTDDSVTILRFASDALKLGMAAALVTLIEIRGGAPRPLGAQMAVREDGLYCGFVSGGCIESAAAFEALEVISCGQDRTIIYGEGSPWFDIVLPCGGAITLGIHKLRSAQPLLAVLNTLEQRRCAGLGYNPQLQTLRSIFPTRESVLTGTDFEVRYRPRTRLIICGCSVEAQAAARVAQAAGYEVHLNDFRLPISVQIDADTAVILLDHDLDRELPVLQAALAAMPFYIGALGSSRTHVKRVQKLHELGWLARDTDRIKAPIGIFPKAHDANSLALSVLADVAAARLSSA